MNLHRLIIWLKDEANPDEWLWVTIGFIGTNLHIVPFHNSDSDDPQETYVIPLDTINRLEAIVR